MTTTPTTPAADATKVLTLDDKLKCEYCIPMWLRDEQIKLATARVKGRIQPGAETQELIAVVGFGPSLRHTWEQVRQFQHVITCSGSHRFLLDRGIVPTYHVEVDPRDHKITLLGAPDARVEYLVASACHPRYFDHLTGFNVKLWHVFDPTDEGLRQLPPGEWAVTGGCDAGLRAITIAAFLGYRQLHVFGMDGCAAGQEEDRHAASHPNGKQKYQRLEYEGRTYWTTPGMLTAAKQLWHELNQLNQVTAKFYGEGLVQEMARRYVRQPPASGQIAFAKPELISAEYAALNTELHRTNLAYGVGGGKHAGTVKKLVANLKLQSVLDYGCGKGYLAKSLPFPIWEYDPCVEGKTESPKPADLVVCTDVLEHIEPERLKFVLGDLRRVTRQVGFFVIHTGPAGKTLADGRNAHLIQKDRKWWKTKLSKQFVVGKVQQVGPELYVVVGPKPKSKDKAAA